MAGDGEVDNYSLYISKNMTGALAVAGSIFNLLNINGRDMPIVLPTN